MWSLEGKIASSLTSIPYFPLKFPPHMSETHLTDPCGAGGGQLPSPERPCSGSTFPSWSGLSPTLCAPKVLPDFTLGISSPENFPQSQLSDETAWLGRSEKLAMHPVGGGWQAGVGEGARV